MDEVAVATTQLGTLEYLQPLHVEPVALDLQADAMADSAKLGMLFRRSVYWLLVTKEVKEMDVTGLLIALLIGAIAGFLAGQIVKGHGFGLLGNIIVGIVGALVFGALFGNFNLLNSPMLNEIAGGTIGAVILLFLIGLIRKAT